jgi:hypothetical protein
MLRQKVTQEIDAAIFGDVNAGKMGQTHLIEISRRRVALFRHMLRRARVIIPGVAHHVTPRGNNREPVFHSADDRRLYLELLGRQARRPGTRILGYCYAT